MYEKEDSKIYVYEIVYLISFLVLFGARAIGLYEGQLLYNLFLVIGLLTWGIKVLMTEHTMFEYVVIVLLILLTLIIYRNTGEKGILLYFTMMLGMKNVSVNRVFKCGTVVLTISYVLLVVMSLVGINNETMYIQNRSGWGDVFRHSLGYPHPNTLHSTYIVLVAMILYLVGKQTWKILLSVSVGMILVSCYIYLYSGSRTGLLITGVYLGINFWFQMRNNISVVEKILIYLLYPACIVFSIVAPLVVKGKLFDIINKILNTRWGLAVYYLQNEPITLFGTRFKEAPTINHMVDSSFLYSFLQLGVVAFCIITFLYIYLIRDCLKNEAKSELAMIVSFCIMGISDPFLFNLSYKNLVFLFVGKMIYEHLYNVENDLPRLMRFPIQILKIGDKQVRYSRIKISNKQFNVKELIQGVCLFAFVAIISATLYSSCTKYPNSMYVNQAIWEENKRRNLTQSWEGQGEEVFLSIEDVQELKKQGELIVRYEGQYRPMYKIIGDAPRMEYIRNVASVGFWSGVLMVGTFLVITQRKKYEE